MLFEPLRLQLQATSGLMVSSDLQTCPIPAQDWSIRKDDTSLQERKIRSTLASGEYATRLGIPSVSPEVRGSLWPLGLILKMVILNACCTFLGDF
jgi:hypothetical protein